MGLTMRCAYVDKGIDETWASEGSALGASATADVVSYSGTGRFVQAMLQSKFV